MWDSVACYLCIYTAEINNGRIPNDENPWKYVGSDHPDTYPAISKQEGHFIFLVPWQDSTEECSSLPLRVPQLDCVPMPIVATCSLMSPLLALLLSLLHSNAPSLYWLGSPPHLCLETQPPSTYNQTLLHPESRRRDLIDLFLRCAFLSFSLLLISIAWDCVDAALL